MDYLLDAYLLKLDRNYDEDQCTCIAWIGDNPDCPTHGEEACWVDYERQKTASERLGGGK